MVETLDRTTVAQALERIATDLPAQAERLRELDAAIGDGDLGITITLGLGAVLEGLPALQEQDMANLLQRSGMAFNRKAASTFGALYATMMMRAAREVRGLQEIGLADLARMADAAAQGVMERGKSQPGDKTLLDALVPAAQALARAAENGEPLATGVRAAAQAAAQGAQATIEMRSNRGRSSWFADRTVGAQDPGATAIQFMFESLADFIESLG
ncbi:MAG: dihydroxyacetone kinase subunit DhaL [Anaerolineae bacterium]|nr:dihydroxyacetone kinase subunit L [Chloroflexota bacterium]